MGTRSRSLCFFADVSLKDINSTVANRGSVFIGPMQVQISKGCLNGVNEVIIISLQEVIKRTLTGNIPVIYLLWEDNIYL